MNNSEEQRVFSLDDIMALKNYDRIRMINSLIGPRPAHLVGTQSADGVDNLALFNSAYHFCATPPHVGIMCRPLDVRRDTYNNIQQTGHFTLNAVTPALVERTHLCKDKFEAEESEFVEAGIKPFRVDTIPAPFVAESPIKIAVRAIEEHVINISKTVLIVGEVVWVSVAENALLEDYTIDADAGELAAVVGLSSYHQTHLVKRFER